MLHLIILPSFQNISKYCRRSFGGRRCPPLGGGLYTELPGCKPTSAHWIVGGFCTGLVACSPLGPSLEAEAWICSLHVFQLFLILNLPFKYFMYSMSGAVGRGMVELWLHSTVWLVLCGLCSNLSRSSHWSHVCGKYVFDWNQQLNTYMQSSRVVTAEGQT